MHNYAKVPFEKRTFTKEGGPKPALARDRMLTTGVRPGFCVKGMAQLLPVIVAELTLLPFLDAS